MVNVRLNWLDRAVGVLAPKAAWKRGVARAAIDAARSYDGAAVGRRTDGWTTPSSSADALMASSLPKLRDRSRDLTRNNPHARKALNVWVNNAVGAGIMPRAKSGDEKLDAKANELWDEWAKVADADGQMDIYGLQKLAVSGMVEAGETLIRRRPRRPTDGLRVPLQLQIFEGDHLDLLKNGDLGNGRKIVNGVEFGPIGQRAAYWMHQEHPGNTGLVGTSSIFSTSRPVPASEIVHLYHKERTQVRGVPWCSAVIRGLRDLDDYAVAEMVRKKTEACIVAIVLGAEVGQEAIAPYTEDGMMVKDANGNPVERVEPGIIAYAHGGKDIKFNNPGAAGGYPDYKRIGLHDIAAGYLMPYELLSGDLSEVNFSSARVGLVEFRRLVDVIQWLVIIPMAMERIWNWFTEAAWLAGELPTPVVPVEWNPPEFESVNPIDDINADLIAMRAGVKTLFEVIGKRGRNPQEVIREHGEVAKMLDDMGLVFDSDPRKVARAGTEQPSQSKQAEESGQRRLRPVA